MAALIMKENYIFYSTSDETSIHTNIYMIEGYREQYLYMIVGGNILHRGHIYHHHNGHIGPAEEHWGWREGPRASINHCCSAVQHSIGCYYLRRIQTILHTGTLYSWWHTENQFSALLMHKVY